MILRLRPLLFILFLTVVATPARPGGDAPDLGKEKKDGLKVINRRLSIEHLKFLTGPECQGRASGEPGAEVAANYLIERLTELNLEPGGEDGYRQTFTVNAGPFPGQGPVDERPRGPSPTSNVIAILRGTDPELSKELIVLGAHYDHIGFRDLRKRKVYWGADDNASGTTAVLMVAEAFASGRLRPRRSIMFQFFTGEERGLLGSKHYVNRPTWPLGRTVAMLNLDMVGRNDAPRMDIYGNRSSPELDSANAALMEESKFRFEYKGGSIFTRSDHYSFYQKNIPVIFFTSGLHKDYHDLDDEPQALVLGKIERIAEHIYRLLWEIGNRDGRPTFQTIAPSGAAGVLGFAPEPIATTEASELDLGKGRGGVRALEVMRGTPAEAAGVQKGDIILGLAGKYLSDKEPLSELDALADALASRKKHPLLLLRDGRKKQVTIEVE
jgi:hypothetical protein